MNTIHRFDQVRLFTHFLWIAIILLPLSSVRADGVEVTRGDFITNGAGIGNRTAINPYLARP